MDYYSFTDPVGWKAELAWLVTPYPQSGHMSTIDQVMLSSHYTP